MSEQFYGTIAALEFGASSPQLFKAIVEDLDASFQPYGMTSSKSTWIADTIAMIERDSLRVLLGWLPARCDSEHCVLVFSVGHATPGGNILVPRETCEFVRDILLNHLESYLQFDTVFQADATQPVDMELVCTVAEILEMGDTAPVKEERESAKDGAMRRTRELTRDIVLKAASPKPPAASDYPQFPEIIDNGEENADEAELSLQKRLTIYALGATILLYTPPVGATLLVYTTLRDFAPSEQPERTAA